MARLLRRGAGAAPSAPHEPSLLAIGNRTESPDCLVEQAVNAALGRAVDEAEAMLLSRFASVTLAQLSADFHDRLFYAAFTWLRRGYWALRSGEFR